MSFANPGDNLGYDGGIRRRDGDSRDESRGSIRISFKCLEQLCNPYCVGSIVTCPAF